MCVCVREGQKEARRETSTRLGGKGSDRQRQAGWGKAVEQSRKSLQDMAAELARGRGGDGHVLLVLLLEREASLILSQGR